MEAKYNWVVQYTMHKVEGGEGEISRGLGIGDDEVKCRNTARCLFGGTVPVRVK